MKVEILFYEDERNFIDKIVSVPWNGLSVPVVPLVCAQKFYVITNREQKAKEIADFMKGKVY